MSSIYTSKEHPHIGSNHLDQKSTKTFVSFKGKRMVNYKDGMVLTNNEAKEMTPFIGEKALNYLDIRPWMGTGMLPLFIDHNSEKLDAIENTYNLKPNGARINNIDLQRLFYKLYLKSLDVQKIKSTTIAVPAYFTVPQRWEVEKIFTDIGANNVTTVDDVDCVSTLYAINRADHDHKVLFVDIGASAVEAYIVRFEPSIYGVKVTRLTYAYRELSGGESFTGLIAGLIEKKLNLRTPTDDEKRRILTAARNLKEVLTLIDTKTMIIEDIDGSDRKITLTRAEINTVSRNLVNTVREVIREALTDKVESIEVIGGASRTPIVAGALKLNNIPVRHSLNADEAIALGAGYLSQQKNGLSMFKPITYQNKCNIHTVSLNTGDREPVVIAKKGEKTIKRASKMEVGKSGSSFALSYDDIRGVRTKQFAFEIPQLERDSIVNIEYSESPVTVKNAYVGNLFSHNNVSVNAIKNDQDGYLWQSVMEAEESRAKVGRMRSELESLHIQGTNVLDQYKKHLSDADSANFVEVLDSTLKIIGKTEATILEVNDAKKKLQKALDHIHELIPTVNGDL